MPHENATSTDRWFAEITAGLAVRHVVAQELSAEAGTIGLSVTLRPNRSVTLSFDRVPDDLEPRFEFAPHSTGAFVVDLENLAPDKLVTIGRSGPWGIPSTLTVNLASSVEGTVVVSREGISGHPLLVHAASGYSGTVRVGREGEVATRGDLTGDASLVLDGGELVLDSDGGRIAKVKLMSQGTIRRRGSSKTRIQVLSVEGSNTSLHLNGAGHSLHAIRGADVADPNTLVLSSENDNAIGVDEVHQLRLTPNNAKLTVRVRDLAEQVEVVGPAHLDFAAGCVGTHLTCTAGNEAPSISGDRGAVLTEVTGPVLLGKCAGVQIEGATEGTLEVQGAATHPDSQSPSWTDLTIKNFTTSGGLHGRAVLAMLAPAAFIEPHTTGLPGWRDRWNSRALKKRYRRDSIKLRQDLEYVRALNHLCADVGAPGSTRTRVAWASYRLRQEASSWSERGLLSMYRLVGYGERPVPAFALWAIAALLIGLIVHARANSYPWSFDAASIAEWLHESVRQAVDPLGSAFRLEVEGKAPMPAWLVALKLLVVVPLATGLLALRNLVKEK